MNFAPSPLKVKRNPLALLLWILATILFVTGICFIAYAKSLGDISFAIMGSVAWGAAVLSTLMGLLFWFTDPSVR